MKEHRESKISVCFAISSVLLAFARKINERAIGRRNPKPMMLAERRQAEWRLTKWPAYDVMSSIF